MIFRNFIFILSAFILPINCLADPNIIIDQEAYSYALPSGWEMFEQNEDSGFRHSAFYNEQTDIMIELAVSKKLDSASFIKVKQAFSNDFGKDKPQLEMKSVSHTVVEITPYGKVDEDIYQSTKADYNHITYALYNKNYIALITFTLHKNKTDILDVARLLLSGFKWEKVTQ